MPLLEGLLAEKRGSKTFILIPVNIGVHRLFKRTGLPIGALTKLVK